MLELEGEEVEAFEWVMLAFGCGLACGISAPLFRRHDEDENGGWGGRKVGKEWLGSRRPLYLDPVPCRRLTLLHEPRKRHGLRLDMKLQRRLA